MKAAVRPNPELEAEIDVAYNQMLAAKDDAERRIHWVEMMRLINLRSPVRVKRMERELGLDQRATFVPRQGRGRLILRTKV